MYYFFLLFFSFFNVFWSIIYRVSPRTNLVGRYIRVIVTSLVRLSNLFDFPCVLSVKFVAALRIINVNYRPLDFFFVIFYWISAEHINVDGETRPDLSFRTTTTYVWLNGPPLHTPVLDFRSNARHVLGRVCLKAGKWRI